VVPATGCSAAVPCWLALEWHGLETKTLALALEQALHLLLSGYAKDVLQLLVLLVDPNDGGHRRGIQECCGCSHILASPSKGGMQRTFMVVGGGDGPGPSSSFGEIDWGGPLRPLRDLALV
jgi:hypothetical protein